ncbi:MAG: LacI family DNA-binding transcriptional regulator [Pseudonocardia sp.]
MTVADEPGIVDDARRAGVSASTVSRSLRGAADVSPASDRVLRAAGELAYVPSPAASRLGSGRTGAERALRTAGVNLLLHNLGDSTSRLPTRLVVRGSTGPVR